MSDTSRHTCSTSGRSSCAPCMQFEADLWDAINRYAIAVGGDPAAHVYGNTTRMQAVADVGKIVDRVAARERIDDLAVDDLASGGNAAAARACETVPVYESAKKLGQMWRDQRTAPFDLLDRLAAHFTKEPPKEQP